MRRQREYTVDEVKAMAVRHEKEDPFQARVIALAELCGFRVYHTHDSRGSQEGFPDLVMIRGPRQIVAELKREGEKPTPEQLAWLYAFGGCGAEVFVWRPSDWDEVVRVLE